MTERERLTKMLSESEPIHERNMDDDWGDGEIEEIADHLLANGVIVPPCQIGDMLYYPFVALDVEGKEYCEMASGEAVSFSKDNRQKWVYSRYGNGLTMWHTFDDFGKTVFLTKEDAEKALAERYKENATPN